MSMIKSTQDIKSRPYVEKVKTPEWGKDDTHVYVRALSNREYEKWQLSLMAQSKGEGPRATLDRVRGSNARLVVLGACDDKGAQVFTDSDISFLLDQNNRALQRVADAITRLSNIGNEDETVDEFEGNSESGQPSSSISGSPSTSD